MLNQSFNESELIRLITFDDYKKYEGFGESRRKTLETLNKISNKINSADFIVSSVIKILNDSNEIFSLSKVEDDFALRKINDSLKRFYKVKQADRNLIVNQIIILLQEAVPMSIIKLDLKKFYESIDRKWIIDKLRDDALLSARAINVLEDFFELSEFTSFTGLPRGIGISATLSELYLRDFDRKVNRLDSVYYYARYVDDIILFTTKAPEEILKEIKEKKLLREPLLFNDKKTKKYEVNNYDKASEKELNFEYLGYKFLFTDCCKKAKNEFTDKKIEVSIAQSKVNKYKTRIVRSFLDYLKNGDFSLLEDRMKFLTGNYPIKRNTSEGTILYAGLYYNYPFINDKKTLEELTIFLRKIINSKNKSFGTKINSSLSNSQKGLLSKYSFLSGWNNRKINADFNPERVKLIKQCWHND
ncbi:antiviral reverse transcriptase Drt3a [Arenibacter sp. ARW7G5Y1]|uniref:antiviral reverse transcriptase Drt3a n=1 Tax=Arenibacter sp. ARW7G5Y1 TaxID=2135619 RepID=UPI000D7558C8|nr:antiviral reverse transcriptase Drt3a [Arenibacter sp. ARW7G5Y1]PXX29720.1 reverse transcriptase (RNA-dependent DNA polymerase) [Arenibacter sp. ARW7G5Y1]